MKTKYFFKDYCKLVDRDGFAREAGSLYMLEYAEYAKIYGHHYGVMMEHKMDGQILIFNFSRANKVIRRAKMFDSQLANWRFYIVDWRK